MVMTMSKDSVPLMFIDTINIINESKKMPVVKENKVYLNRLDDIRAMIYYKINILCEIKTKNTLLEGVVKQVDENGLNIMVNNNLITIPICEIEDINILKV